MIARIRAILSIQLDAQGKSNLKNSFGECVDFFDTNGSVFLLIPVLLSTIGPEMFGNRSTLRGNLCDSHSCPSLLKDVHIERYDSRNWAIPFRYVLNP